MKRRLHWVSGFSLLGGLALACAEPPSVNRAPAVAPAARARESADTVWVELPRSGVRARLQEPVAISRQQENEGEEAYTVVSAMSAQGEQLHMISRYSRFGRSRAEDATVLTALHKMVKSVEREQPLELGGFSGVELVGHSSEASIWMRGYVIGDGFVLAMARRNDGPLDESAARAFLDSLELKVAWSIHSFPEFRVSILLPDGGMEFGPRELDLEHMSVAKVVSIGGSGAYSFGLFARPLRGEESGRADRGLGEYEKNLALAGSAVLSRRTLSFDGAPGVELVLQSNADVSRVRALTTDSDVYVLEVRAHAKAALQSNDVTRFFESLRWYPPR